MNSAEAAFVAPATFDVKIGRDMCHRKAYINVDLIHEPCIFIVKTAM